MANIIPMAGEGSRYSKVGYTLPKPMIPVLDIPMIIKAIRDMPPSDKWIFMVRKEHIDNYKIDELIKTEVPNAIIVAVENTTEGQACTCMLAEPYLDPDEPVFIAACDNGFLYDKQKYDGLCNDDNIDCIVWTFTQRETLRRNPAAWGWINLDDDGITIKNVSVKIPVSEDPYNDHAVVASFYFKKAKDFIEATNLMIKEDYRIRDEFYVDSIPLFLKKLGKRSVIFDVDLYVCWGTPEDLKDYQKWERICNKNEIIVDLSEEDKKLLNLFEDYFRKGASS